MRADIATITCQIEIKPKLSFWDAIKLRIAGKNYEPVVEALLKAVAEQINAEKI